jgi:chromosome segregation ATPase
MGLFSKERTDADQAPPAPDTREIGNISFGSDDEYREKSESRVALNSQRLKSNYGINDTIKLLRKLSHIDDEVKIVVAKTTLESMNVVIRDIITDASAKEEKVSAHITSLKDEISDLEAEIKKRSDQISALEKDLSETKEARICLEKGEPKAKPAVKEAKVAKEVSEKNNHNTPKADKIPGAQTDNR